MDIVFKLSFSKKEFDSIMKNHGEDTSKYIIQEIVRNALADFGHTLVTEGLPGYFVRALFKEKYGIDLNKFDPVKKRFTN